MMEIPLSGGAANAHQVITVQLGDELVELTLDYQQSGQWSMNVRQEGLLIMAGAILEPNCDVIESWLQSDKYGRLVFVGSATTLDNLGTDNHLIWVSPDEL